MLDRALVLWLPRPDTVTGDDIVELHLHGSVAVVMAVESALTRLGYAAAERGAFTRRAFENGRLDLSQVEGLANLMNAVTQRQRVAALSASEGGLRALVERWQDVLIALAARIEAAIDMPDEDDVPHDDPTVRQDLLSFSHTLQTALEMPSTERLRDGVRVVLAGPPNAGKSSLLNALVGREAAISAATPGTTRDVIEVPVVIDDVPIILVDTAGLHDAAADAVEAIGIDRAIAVINRADLVLWLGPEDQQPRGNVILVAAKSDILRSTCGDAVEVSSLTGENIARLTVMIAQQARRFLPSAGGLTLSVHQKQMIADAAAAMLRASAESDIVLQLRSCGLQCMASTVSRDAPTSKPCSMFCSTNFVWESSVSRETL